MMMPSPESSNCGRPARPKICCTSSIPALPQEGLSQDLTGFGVTQISVQQARTDCDDVLDILMMVMGCRQVENSWCKLGKLVQHHRLTLCICLEGQQHAADFTLSNAVPMQCKDTVLDRSKESEAMQGAIMAGHIKLKQQQHLCLAQLPE